MLFYLKPLKEANPRVRELHRGSHGGNCQALTSLWRRDPRVSPNSNSKTRACGAPAPGTADLSALRDPGGGRPADTGLFCLNSFCAAGTGLGGGGGPAWGRARGPRRRAGALRATASRRVPWEGGRGGGGEAGVRRCGPLDLALRHPTPQHAGVFGKEGSKRPERLRFRLRTKSLASARQHLSNERCYFKTF